MQSINKIKNKNIKNKNNNNINNINKNIIQLKNSSYKDIDDYIHDSLILKKKINKKILIRKPKSINSLTHSHSLKTLKHLQTVNHKNIVNNNNKPNVIVIGLGEVGIGILKNIEKSKQFNVFKFDSNKKKLNKIPKRGLPIDVMHICIPYDKNNFIWNVESYIYDIKPKLVIINSTVAVGTCRELEQLIKVFNDKSLLVHSPIRGVHPHLEDGIKRFVKYVGGPLEDRKQALKHFQKLKIKVKEFPDYESTELAKLVCTTIYGWDIIATKEIKRLCDKFNVKYKDVCLEWNKTYNQGYSSTDYRTDIRRPILYPLEGKIGGHCIIPNAEILNECEPNFLSEFIKNKGN